MPPEVKAIFTKRRLRFLAAYTIFFLAVILIAYHSEINQFVIGVLDLFAPVFLGLVIAYLCNPLFRFLERKVFFRIRIASLRRALSMLCTYLTYTLLIALILLLILPQLIISITTFIGNYQTHVNSVIDSINGTIYFINDILNNFMTQKDPFSPIDGAQFFDGLFAILTALVEQINLNDVTALAGGLFGGIADGIFALFISIYLLASKEKRYRQVIKIRNALLSEETNKRVTKICTTADQLFGQFVKGRFLDCLIVGTLTYISMSLIGIPYPILIAAFIAIVNIIPYIGFLLGSVPALLIVLLTQPDKLVPSLIILFFIYQIDSNVISPKILGENTGVSTLCVIIAICVMGTVFGPVGMIIGVPFFAVILEIGDAYIHSRLQKKKLPDDVENYYAPDTIFSPHNAKPQGSDKFNQWLIKKVLQANHHVENGEEDQLTRTHRVCLKIYSFGRRLHILEGMTPAVLTQFSAQRAERRIAQNTAQALEQRLAASTASSEAPVPDPASPTDDTVAEEGDA